MNADIAGTARQRILTTPGDVIVDVVMRIEPDFDRWAVTLVAEQVADTRTKQRRLAHALHEDPTLLTSGRPAGPRLIALLITELQQLGPTKLTLPCCARCRQPRPLRERDGEGQRICSPCARTRRTAQGPCASCGEHRRIAGQDRHGRPLCHRCHQPQRTDDFLAVIHCHLVALDTGLSDDDLRRVVVATLPQPHRQRQVGWELEDHAERLGTNAALGSHQLVRLAEALSSRGARHIPPPACTRCGSSKRVHYGIDGARCCRTCYELSRQQTCSRCHKLKHISTRTLEGVRSFLSEGAVGLVTDFLSAGVGGLLR